jgi:hypothetical protein
MRNRFDNQINSLKGNLDQLNNKYPDVQPVKPNIVDRFLTGLKYRDMTSGNPAGVSTEGIGEARRDRGDWQVATWYGLFYSMRPNIRVLRELLASRFTEAQVGALDRLKALGDDRRQFDADVKSFVLKADDKLAPAALRSLADFPHLANDAEVQQRIAASLGARDQNLLRAGVRLVLAKPELRNQPAIAAALDTLLKTEEPAKRKLILDLVNNNTLVENDLRLTGMIADSLEDADENTRSAALGAVRRVKSLQSNAAIRAGLAKLTKDPNQRLQGLAIAIYQGQDGGVALDLRAEEMLDYNFFVARVMPLLSRRGADGNGCVNCHSTHTIFRLIEPDKQGRFTDAAQRENYRSALKVVDLANPENSLLLRKPTSDSSVEGVAGASQTAHGGGVRWQGASDPAYREVLEWINGAKVKAAVK